jgi:hypothetical protein
MAGVIMGTAAYMAPEQARGQNADKGADIWAFGAVVYEMLTGRGLFAGEIVSDTLAGVLKSDPDWSVLPAETPVAIRRLLRKCLERDRKRRLHDIADARIEIEEALAEPQPPPAAPAAMKQQRRLDRGGRLLLGAFGLWQLWLGRHLPENDQVMRFQIHPPGGTLYSGGRFRRRFGGVSRRPHGCLHREPFGYSYRSKTPCVTAGAAEDQRRKHSGRKTGRTPPKAPSWRYWCRGRGENSFFRGGLAVFALGQRTEPSHLSSVRIRTAGPAAKAHFPPVLRWPSAAPAGGHTGCFPDGAQANSLPCAAIQIQFP